MPTLADRIQFSGPSTVEDEESLHPGTVEMPATPVVLRESLPRLIPAQLLLGSLRDSRLRIVDALQVVISQEDGQIVAEAVELNEFGWGANLGEALADLQRAAAELYFQLDADQERLGPGLRAVWGTLRAKIRRS